MIIYKNNNDTTFSYEAGSWGDTPGEIKTMTLSSVTMLFLRKVEPKKGFPVREKSAIVFWVDSVVSPLEASDFSEEEYTLLKEKYHQRERLAILNPTLHALYIFAFQAGLDARWGVGNEFDYAKATAEIDAQGLPSWDDSYFDSYTLGVELSEKGKK